MVRSGKGPSPTVSHDHVGEEVRGGTYLSPAYKTSRQGRSGGTLLSLWKEGVPRPGEIEVPRTPNGQTVRGPSGQFLCLTPTQSSGGTGLGYKFRLNESHPGSFDNSGLSKKPPRLRRRDRHPRCLPVTRVKPLLLDAESRRTCR